jgi:hypothetical protein
MTNENQTQDKKKVMILEDDLNSIALPPIDLIKRVSKLYGAHGLDFKERKDLNDYAQFIQKECVLSDYDMQVALRLKKLRTGFGALADRIYSSNFEISEKDKKNLIDMLPQEATLYYRDEKKLKESPLAMLYEIATSWNKIEKNMNEEYCNTLGKYYASKLKSDLGTNADVEIISNAASAIRKIEGTKYDFVLSDMNLSNGSTTNPKDASLESSLKNRMENIKSKVFNNLNIQEKVFDEQLGLAVVQLLNEKNIPYAVFTSSHGINDSLPVLTCMGAMSEDDMNFFNKNRDKIFDNSINKPNSYYPDGLIAKANNIYFTWDKISQEGNSTNMYKALKEAIQNTPGRKLF